VEYQGTLILVSHDRSFLNNVVGSTIVFEGTDDNPGIVNEYIGGYDDWLWQRKQIDDHRKTAKIQKQKETVTAIQTPSTAKKKKLNFNDQRELDNLPKKIEELENKISQQTETMNDPTFYQQDKEAIAAFNTEASKTQAELDQCYARWEELE